MDAYDADVLIYAAESGHPLGRRLLPLLDTDSGTGSVLLLVEVLSRPSRLRSDDELRSLGRVLSRLTLLPLDRPTAMLAVGLAASYRLRAADATHLATAVISGADRFITDNRRDFPQTIGEVEVVYPDALPDPAR